MTDSQFDEEVNTVYMNTDIDKDMFCELWVKHPAALKEIERLSTTVRLLFDERKSTYNFLVDEAHKMSSPDARSKAISLMGERAYLKAIIAKGYDLWESDKELLVDILSR